MVVWGRSTDRSGAYRRNLVLTTGIGSAALFAMVPLLGVGPAPALAAISVAVVAFFASFGPFWTLPAAFLRGTAAAAGIAVINSCGNLGGFASPWLVGVIRQRTGSFEAGIAAIAGILLVAMLLIAFGRFERNAPLDGSKKV
jgi:ACS family tartrate transporter-like MFS transporter